MKVYQRRDPQTKMTEIALKFTDAEMDAMQRVVENRAITIAAEALANDLAATLMAGMNKNVRIAEIRDLIKELMVLERLRGNKPC